MRPLSLPADRKRLQKFLAPPKNVGERRVLSSSRRWPNAAFNLPNCIRDGDMIMHRRTFIQGAAFVAATPAIAGLFCAAVVGPIASNRGSEPVNTSRRDWIR